MVTTVSNVPELPEVETVRRGLAPLITGSRIARVVLNRPDLRFAFPRDFAARLSGRTIVAVGRRAKYLLLELDSGDTLLSHLGMTGTFRVADAALTAPTRLRSPDRTGRHDHVVFALDRDGRAAQLVYNDTRRFGFMDIFTDPLTCRWLAHLGPEPLGNGLSARHLAERFGARSAPVKAGLLDQRVVAGLGNIYVCEALWRAKIAPTTPVGALVAADGGPEPALERLVRAVRGVLEDAIAAGGSTLRDFRNADGGAGYFQHSFDVYGRAGEACRKPACPGTIMRIVQSGRSSFYCPVCQG